MFVIPILFKKLGLGLTGCLAILAILVVWTAFVVWFGGWFWGDLVYNHLLSHPFTHHALTERQWLIVGAALAIFAG